MVLQLFLKWYANNCPDSALPEKKDLNFAVADLLFDSLLNWFTQFLTLKETVKFAASQGQALTARKRAVENMVNTGTFSTATPEVPADRKPKRHCPNGTGGD